MKRAYDSGLSAYFNRANRNNHWVAVDISSAKGQVVIRALAQESDILVQNFKPSRLGKYAVDHEPLRRANPGHVYCSISGFRQTGPNTHKPGYDLMAQGHGRIMSLTDEPDRAPMKVGVGIADVMCGINASSAILEALFHKCRTGEG